MAKKKPKTVAVPSFTFIHDDCLHALKDVQGQAPTLVIADPPYNVGKDYQAYHDKQPVSDFLQWLEDRMRIMRTALAPHGSMWVFINDALVSEVDVLCKRAGFYKRNHVVWHYTFGVNHKKQFTPSHTHLLYYTKSRSKWTFNADAVLQPSARQVKYNDKRAHSKGRLPDNTWVLFPEQLPAAFDPAGDTWLASRVCGTFREREKHSPNQIPVPLMERIVRTCSNPGELVLDAFMGTGSAGVACATHGRNYLGFDVSDVCVSQSSRRVLEHYAALPKQ